MIVFEVTTTLGHLVYGGSEKASEDKYKRNLLLTAE